MTTDATKNEKTYTIDQSERLPISRKDACLCRKDAYLCKTILTHAIEKIHNSIVSREILCLSKWSDESSSVSMHHQPVTSALFLTRQKPCHKKLLFDSYFLLTHDHTKQRVSAVSILPSCTVFNITAMRWYRTPFRVSNSVIHSHDHSHSAGSHILNE